MSAAKLLLTLSACGLLLSAGCGRTETGYSEKDSQTSLAALQAGWENPPQGARPRVWWHWMNGNITREGISKDLGWMARIGLGGVHNFDAAMQTPDIVSRRLIYMDAGWQDAFGHAVRTADSLGLEFTVASAPGWSSTGGPWVEPKDAMKRLVWRTVEVPGGRVDTAFPKPFSQAGAFQNGAAAGRGTGARIDFYEDVAVIAVKIPETQKTLSELGARVTSSGGRFTLEQLTDGDIANGSLLPSDTRNGFAWIQYEFPQDVTVRSVTLTGAGGGGFGGGPATASLESSTDGKHFTKVCDLRGGSVSQTTLTVPPTAARYFRVCFLNPRPQGGDPFGMGAPARRAPQGTVVSELALYPYTRVTRFEDKAGFSAAANLTAVPTPASDEAFPAPDDVIDVTEHFRDGRLRWDAPAGRWRIYRFGYSLTGKQNHPAPLEATGLEVDKLDPVAWDKYFHTYLDMYRKASGGRMGAHGVQYVLTDSYEAECETWTPAMFSAFREKRGYDLTAWMPVLAGEVIGSPAQSDAFLFDWRATLGELLADNYSRISEIAREDYGMLGRYTESHEGGRAYVGDGMDLKRTAEVPMSAMWVTAPWLPMTPDGEIDRSTYDADDKESASVAHIYGQNVAAAESMTAPGQGGLAYSYHPGNLKFIADIELSNGINRFVIHESAHQPDDVHVPGLSLGGIGQWFNRHDTWAEMAGAWVDYLSRSCFMLQAGQNVADVLYYYGEDSNVTAQFARAPQTISGYQWDYCSPDALIHEISCRDGRLVAGSGASYRVLFMDRNVEYMSLPVLRKIAELAREGAWIGGPRPAHPASLTDDAAEFARLVAQTWDGGLANVVETGSLAELLKRAGLSPDAAYPEGMKFLHRTLPSAEIYWLNKPSHEARSVEVSFRVSGLVPQLWHPEDGRVEAAAYRTEGGRTVVEIPMVPDDAVFVVFAGQGPAAQTLPARTETVLQVVGAPWEVRFQEKRGAPATASFARLASYTESADPGIRYFSGVASYVNTLTVDAVEGDAVLDLGCVKDLAEVYVNGQYCGTAWKEPYRVDVSRALKPGENTLEVRVANTWPNRLIGDEQPGAKRVAWTDSRPYRASDALRPAGLLGPVKLVGIQ